MNLLASLLSLSLILISGGLPARQISGGRHCVEPGKGQFSILRGQRRPVGACLEHDHTIEAKEITGCADVNEADLTRSSVELTFARQQDYRARSEREPEGPHSSSANHGDGCPARSGISFHSFPLHRRAPGIKTKRTGLVVQVSSPSGTGPNLSPFLWRLPAAENGLIRVKGEYSFARPHSGWSR